MNMNLLEVVTPASIYCGCSTRNILWEENFTPSEFTPVKMKIYGRSNVMKHREINNGEKYTTLDISLKFDSLDKMKIASSYPKYYLGESGKGLITSPGLNTIGSSKKKSQVIPLLMSV